MMKRISLAALITLSLVVTAWRVGSADDKHNFAKWEKEITAYEEKDRTDPPPKGGILFTGASTIRKWTTLKEDFPGLPVINRRFGGSEILDCTHFADRIVFPYQPKMIFFRSGGNDIHNGKTAEQVYADYKEFVTKVREKLPDTEIYFIAQNPTIARWSQREQEQALNKMVADYSKTTPKLKFIDISSLPLDNDGQPRAELFVEDKLHFNAAGYKLLAEAIRPYLPKPDAAK
jgi:lysophospholipase L1-like esterase